MEQQNEFLLWIGCLTQSGSEGIYSGYLNQETGQINQLQLQGKSQDITYMLKHPKEQIIISTKRGQIYDKDGAVDVWQIESNNKLTHLQQVSSKGEIPCFLCLSADNKSLYVTNYTSGTVAKYKYQGGSLSVEKVVLNPYPKQKQHERQEKQHAHSIIPFKNKFLICADLGSDLLVIYDNDLNVVETCQMNENCGPRHCQIIENVILVVGELDQTLNIVQFDEQIEKFKLVNSYKTIEEKQAQVAQCSHIIVSNDKKYVYIGNRTHDSITTFERIDDSYLNWQYKFNVTCGGLIPRHIEFSPNQSFILCANQNGNSVTILKRDDKTGELTLTDNNLQIKNPMFVLFQ